MRELPFSVWKARRTVVSSPRSSAASASAASAACAFSHRPRALPRGRSRASRRRLRGRSGRPMAPCARRRSRRRRASASGIGCPRAAGRRGVDAVSTKSVSACASSARAASRSSPVVGRARDARPAPCWPLRPARGWSATSASCDRRSRSRDTSSSGTSARAAADASDCACSTRRGATAGAGAASRRAEAGRAVAPPPTTERRHAGVRVEDEQRLRHLRLHAEHVDQEAERAEVAGQAVERGRRGRRACWSTSVCDQRVDVVAHAQHGVRGLVQAEHRQHAAHRRQLRRAPGCSTSRSAGLRKNWSIAFSASDSDARSSCTTLPMVWRSETRRYSSSIHGFERLGRRRPGARASMRCARRAHALGLRRDGRSRRPRARPRGRARWWRLPSPAPAPARRRRAPSARPRPAARSASVSPPGYSRCSDRRRARTARPGRTGGAARRRRPPTSASLAAPTRLRACATNAGSKRPRRARCRSRPARGRRQVRRPGARRPGAARGGRRRASAAWAQKNSRSCASRSDTSVSPRSPACAAAPAGATRRACCRRRPQQALRLRLRRRRRPAATAWRSGAASARRRRGRRTGRSCARPRGRIAAWRISAEQSAPRARRAASASARAAPALGSSAASRHCQSCGHRSAGCTRSAPASSCTRAVLREQRQRRHRLAGQHARQVVEQRERGLLDGLDRGRVDACAAARPAAAPRPRWRAAACAAAGRPTSSSAPTPWWICERAWRSTAGSTASTSEPASASASFR